MRDINRLAELCQNLVEYSKDPHPGLISWNQCVAKTVERIADEAIKVTFGKQITTIDQIEKLGRV